MLSVLDGKYHGDYSRSFDALLEFLAVNNSPPVVTQLPDKLGWLYGDMETYERLIDAYHHETLRSDFDSLGDIYIENQSRLGQSYKGQFLTPENACRMMAKMNAAEYRQSGEKKDGPILVADPAVGTGRMLLATYDEFGDDVHYFGVDIDRRALQIAFINAGNWDIHNCYLLHADTVRHDIRPGGPNWRYANLLWGPLYWDELEELPTQERQDQAKDEEDNQLNPFG